MHTWKVTNWSDTKEVSAETPQQAAELFVKKYMQTILNVVGVVIVLVLEKDGFWKTHIIKKK